MGVKNADRGRRVRADPLIDERPKCPTQSHLHQRDRRFADRRDDPTALNAHIGIRSIREDPFPHKVTEKAENAAAFDGGWASAR